MVLFWYWAGHPMEKRDTRMVNCFWGLDSWELCCQDWPICRTVLHCFKQKCKSKTCTKTGENKSWLTTHLHCLLNKQCLFMLQEAGRKEWGRRKTKNKKKKNTGSPCWCCRLLWGWFGGPLGPPSELVPVGLMVCGILLRAHHAWEGSNMGRK